MWIFSKVRGWVGGGGVSEVMDGLNMRRPTQLVAALPHSDVSVSFKPDSKRECSQTLPRAKCTVLQLGCRQMCRSWDDKDEVDIILIIKKGDSVARKVMGWSLVLMRERKHCSSLIAKRCATDIATTSVYINTIAHRQQTHVGKMTNSTNFIGKQELGNAVERVKIYRPTQLICIWIWTNTK